MFKFGTSSVVPIANMLNTFPYKNRTSGQSPDAATLDGKRIVESFETRGGGMHNCMTGCIVRCSNIVHDAEGKYRPPHSSSRRSRCSARTARLRAGRRGRPRPPV